MPRVAVIASGIGLVALTGGCLLVTDLSGLSGSESDGLGESDGGPTPDASTGGDSGLDAAGDSSTEFDSGSDASTCTCAGLVSAYRFSDPTSLGRDFYAKNSMGTVRGTPKQSTKTPDGLGGHSIELNGSSAVCIDSGFTFDSTADHTLCWWSQPASLANDTNQFAQFCGYDTWTDNSGHDYVWRVNNCNNGTSLSLDVPNVYAAGKWVQICQTYKRASLTRAVVVNGETSGKVSMTDSAPIVESPSAPWCIGSYGGGGYWTGLIYLPLWFNRVLSDAEIQQVHATACCLP